MDPGANTVVDWPERLVCSHCGRQVDVVVTETKI
jgi:hypothetical protein